MGLYKVKDEDLFHKFGYAVATDSWTALSFAASGGTLWAPPTGSALRVKAGGHASDVAGGAGATAVTLYGIDTSGAVISPTVATAGASASDPTSETFLRLYRVIAGSDTYITAPGGGNNVGNIVIETTGGVAVATVPALFGQSQISHYFVPLNKCLHAQRLIFTIQRATGGAKDIELRLMHRANTLASGTLSSPLGARCIRYWKVEDSIGTFTNEAADEDFRFDELNEWWVEAKCSSGTATVTFAMEGHLKIMRWKEYIEL